MNLNVLNTAYNAVKESKLFGRYITNNHIKKCLDGLQNGAILTLGYSVNKQPIYSVTYGSGKTKILLWSQMHGNESTSTKAVFDCFNFFESNNADAKTVLEKCTICVIPILNPDGAERYTRVNANAVDINRDAQDLTQPESKILRALFNDFKPDYCFNLHGQRTIYSVAATNVSSTLSFLAPSQDENLTITPNRKKAMSIIAALHTFLQPELPNGISRYDDAFNLNCVGDTFQHFNVPTLLYEAGHFPNDYNREEVRRFTFLAILKALQLISNGISTTSYEAYFDIPENQKLFYDIVIRNTLLDTDSKTPVHIGIQYSEVLEEGHIRFLPVVVEISSSNTFYGHKELDAHRSLVQLSDHTALEISNEIDFVIINNEKIALNP